MRRISVGRPFVVSLRRLDHRDLGAVGGMHHLADVREPLRTRRVELPLDEVAHVRAGRGLALRAVPEVEAPAREGDVLVPVGVAVPARPREHQGRVRDALDDDRGRRPAGALDVVQLEGLELGLRVARQLLVELLFLHVAVQDDDAAAGVRHCRDVPDELEPDAGRLRIEALVQLDPLRAALGFRGPAQESVRLCHCTPNLTTYPSVETRSESITCPVIQRASSLQSQAIAASSGSPQRPCGHRRRRIDVAEAPAGVGRAGIDGVDRDAAVHPSRRGRLVQGAPSRVADLLRHRRDVLT